MVVEEEILDAAHACRLPRETRGSLFFTWHRDLLLNVTGAHRRFVAGQWLPAKIAMVEVREFRYAPAKLNPELVVTVSASEFMLELCRKQT